MNSISLLECSVDSLDAHGETTVSAKMASSIVLHLLAKGSSPFS